MSKTALRSAAAEASAAAGRLLTRLRRAPVLARSWFRQHRGGWSVKQRLALLVLAALLPPLLFSAYLLSRFATIDRIQYDQRLKQTVADLADDIHRDLQGMVIILRSLATARSLRQGDFAEFHRQALEVLGDDLRIIVLDPTLQQLVNTNVPYGTPLPKTGDPETARRALQTKAPAISNLFTGAVTHRHSLNVDVPVIERGQPRFILVMSFSPDRILGIMRARNLPAGWVTGLTDRNGIVIARSERHEHYVGTALPSELLARSRVAQDVFESKNLDGIPVARAIGQVKDADWLVAATVPLTVVMSSAHKSWWELGYVAILVLAASGTLAFLHARTLARAVTSTRSAARALGRGEEVLPFATRVWEVSEVAAELSSASRQRRAAEEALRTQEKRLRLTLGAGRLGAWRWIPAEDRIEVDDTFRQLLALPATLEALTGRSVQELVHADDRAKAEALRNRLLAGETRSWQEELRFVRSDGQVRWLAWFGEIEHGADGRIESAFGVVQDITERRALEERQALLMRELQHRTKNILAVVQSIASQTLSQGRSADEAKPSLLGRLQALANASDLASSEQSAAMLADVVRKETAAFSGRVQAAGPPVKLGARAAQTFALLIHELATNASKHGALSTAEGGVSVDWSINGNGDAQRLALRWQERQGPPVVEPARRGFGHTIIEEVAAQEFGVPPVLDYARDGFVYRIDVPMEALRAGDPTGQGRITSG
jgi:two-component sensor histidine kinase